MSQAPKIGQWMMVRGLRCTITKIHPFGTVDVVSSDGKRAFRVTGLPFVGTSDAGLGFLSLSELALTPADAGHPDNVIL